MLRKFGLLLVGIIGLPIYALWRLSGWNYDGTLPELDKYMFVFAPHTSNIDYFHSIPVAFFVRRHPSIMMKQEALDWFIIGKLLRLGGGFGVDRKGSGNTVEQVIEYVHQRKNIVLIIAPEGTRHYNEHWKTGFYHIAHGAGLPMVFGYLNYKEKKMGASPVFYTTGDIQADFAFMADFYRDHAHARHPERFGLPTVAEPAP